MRLASSDSETNDSRSSSDEENEERRDAGKEAEKRSSEDSEDSEEERPLRRHKRAPRGRSRRRKRPAGGEAAIVSLRATKLRDCERFVWPGIKSCGGGGARGQRKMVPKPGTVPE